MKRRIAAAVLAALILCPACAVQQSATAESGNGNGQEPAGTAQMANPFAKYDSLAESEEAAGVSIPVPEAVEGGSNRVYRAIPGELLEVIYYDDSENETARIRKAQGTERLDGDYGEYSTATLHFQQQPLT